MALVAGSLHDWLSQSPHVWGRDQTSAVLGRKKCRRAHRKSAIRAEERAEIADRYAREGSSKISNRRYRRWLNDQLLRELAPPLEAAEIESLFAPPPWGEQRVVTPLERVTGGGNNGPIDMAGWEPFRNVDMDMQAKWIQHSEQARRLQNNGSPGKQTAAMEAWRGVERHARVALRRNPQSSLLQAFEDKLLEFLSEMEGSENESELALEAETSYHRLLLHGLTQFHGLASRTAVGVSNSEHIDAKMSPTGQNVVFVKCRKSKVSSAGRKLSLIEFLRDVQRCPRIGDESKLCTFEPS